MSSELAGSDTSLVAPVVPESVRRSPLARLGAVQRRYPLMQAAALVVLFIFGAATLTGFASYSSVKDVLIITSFLGIAAVGQQIVILVGGIDLGVPAYIALGNFMIPQLVGIDDWPFWAAAVLNLVVASVVGGATGYICSHFKVESLVVTLGIQTMVLGGLAIWTNGLVDAGTPTWLSDIASPATNTFGLDIPPIVVIWALIAVAMAVLLHKTVLGRRIYASGSNPTAASVALLPVERVWSFAFALSAVASSFAGLLLAGYSGTGSLSIGSPYLFSSLAAVIVGGTALVGARGDYWRTVLGALLLTVLTTILIGHGLGDAGQQIFYGLVILLVVPAYGRDRRTADRV
jgi:ribose transport system permease protein